MKPLVAASAAVFLASTCARQPDVVGPPQDPAEPPLAPARVPVDLGQCAYEHVARLVALGPRHTGSPGWQHGLDHILAELNRLGLEPRRDRWHDPKEQLTFENVSVVIPGKRPDKILIAAHHDTKRTEGHPDSEHNYSFVGANDSGSGVGLLLALAAVLEQQEREATIELVFFDGEESIPYKWDRERALFGSRRYARDYAERKRVAPGLPTIRAFVLLDMVGAADLDIDDDSNSEPRLKRIFRRAAEACGHERYFFQHSQTVTDDHLPFRDAGVPVIDLIDIADNPEWHTPRDTLDHVSAESLHVVGQVVLTALPEIERQFVLAASDPAAERR